MGDIIGLNHLAVWKDIEEYEKSKGGTLDKWEVFNKLVKLFYHMRLKQKEWAEEEKEKKEKMDLQKKVGKEAAEEVYKGQMEL